MKKLMLLGIVGSMFVVGQSLVFAGGTNEVKVTEMQKSVVASVEAIGIEDTDLDNLEVGVQAVESVEAVEIVMTQEKAEEFAEILGKDSKEIQKLSMSEFFASLSEEELDKLVDAGAIEMMVATEIEGSVAFTDAVDATENNMTSSIAAVITEEAVKADTNK